MAVAKKQDKQVMDVSKPGKVPASPSARPVIIGHGPMVQDPMVTSAEEDNAKAPEPEEVAAKSPVASKRVITPITEDENTEEPIDEEVKPAQTNEAGNEESPDEQQAVEPEETKADENQESSPDSDAAVVDSVVDQVDIGSKREAEQQAEEERKKQEALNKLIAEKKYFVPIGKTHKKTKAGIALLTLFLAVVLIGMIAAIDAGLLEVSFDLPFDFIK